MNYTILVSWVMVLLRFTNKYDSPVKNQYLFEQTADLEKKAEVWKPPFL